jgi:chaperone modulatory protein CbpM
MIKQTVLSGLIVEKGSISTLEELSNAIGKPAEWILNLVEEGVIQSLKNKQKHWQFSGHCLRRVLIVQRLKSDLGVSLAAAALALELLEEVQTLRNKITLLKH